jgi:hypothetical protein
MIPDSFWYIVMSIITYGVVANELRVYKFTKMMKDQVTMARVSFDKEGGR